jgi:hypothetical protein
VINLVTCSNFKDLDTKFVTAIESATSDSLEYVVKVEITRAPGVKYHKYCSDYSKNDASTYSSFEGNFNLRQCLLIVFTELAEVSIVGV